MNRNITLFLLLSLSFNRLLAQQDSVQKTVQQRQLFFTDSVSSALFNFSKNSPLLIKELIPERISRISIGQQLEKGKLVNAQGSTKTNLSYLSSDGSINLSGLKLYGAFYYHKVFEDSTRFAHQSRNNTSTPYYYGSPTNNHYERSIYNFNTLATKDFLSNKISAGVGFDYHIADHFSNNDPRGSLKEYQLDSKISLGYNFTENIKIGGGLNIGYGKEEVNIGYKNRAYYESTAYPRYVNYLINGYGEPDPKLTNRNYTNGFSRLGYNGTVKILNTNLGSFYFNINQVEEKQVYDYRTSSGIYDLSKYNLTKLNLDILWTKKLSKGTISSVVNFVNWDGADFNTRFLAKNYVYTKNEINLKIDYAKPAKKHLYNYTFSLNNFSEDRLDGITGNKINYNNITFNGNFGFLSRLSNYRSISINFGTHYILPLKDNFFVNNVTEKLFTQEVIIYDYLYNTTQRFGGSITADYSFPFFKFMQASVKLNMVYTDKVGMKTLDRNVTSLPGKDRFSSNISLNLYF